MNKKYLLFLPFLFFACENIPYECDVIEEPIDTNVVYTFTDVYQVFSDNCISCHTTGNRYLDLSESVAYENLINKLTTVNQYDTLVIPYDAENSVLFKVLNGSVGDIGQMPQGSNLPEIDKNIIKKWINDGAKKE